MPQTPTNISLRPIGEQRSRLSLVASFDTDGLKRTDLETHAIVADQTYMADSPAKGPDFRGLA